MKNQEPRVCEFMTLQPQTIESKQSLADASRWMERLGIRHLPVTTDGIVTGILSKRELELAMQVEVIDSKQLSVSEACSTRPYFVYPETPLREVAGVMASEHRDSAIVMENAKIVGVFTVSDICRALGVQIEERLQEEGLRRVRDMRACL